MRRMAEFRSAAIPLATMNAERIGICYDLMNSAYDAQEIRAVSLGLDQVSIIDISSRRDAVLKVELAREA